MRTQLVPTCASAKGSSASTMPISAKPTHTSHGRFRVSKSRCIRRAAPERSCAIPHSFAQQTLRPEHQHQDKHHERENVLVGRAEQDEMAAAVEVPDEPGEPAVLAQVVELAYVARAQGLDQPEHDPA